MEYLDNELLKWPEASNEIEEETRKMVQERHRFWFSFFIIFAAIVAGFLFLKAGGFGIFIGIFCFLGHMQWRPLIMKMNCILKRESRKRK